MISDILIIPEYQSVVHPLSVRVDGGLSFLAKKDESCRYKYKPDNHKHYRGDMFMPREVIIGDTTFIVNSYSREDATETLDEMLRRVIVKNAEQELKKRPAINSNNCPEVC